jgi:hypothetical protein
MESAYLGMVSCIQVLKQSYCHRTETLKPRSSLTYWKIYLEKVHVMDGPDSCLASFNP